ncbi:MAG TPA: hypothetical protein VEH04_19140 [Verrucomicrobiae bacterium]|nr:hypothetical protein [Verrucomicrobiae bacterium]
MSVPLLILLYLAITFSALAALMIYGELRQRRFTPTPSQDTIFRCTRCGFVYTDDPGVDRSRCSQCGQLNEAIRF